MQLVVFLANGFDLSCAWLQLPLDGLQVCAGWTSFCYLNLPILVEAILKRCGFSVWSFSFVVFMRTSMWGNPPGTNDLNHCAHTL